MKVFARKELQTLSLVGINHQAKPKATIAISVRPEPGIKHLRSVESVSIRRPRLSIREVTKRLSGLNTVDVMRVNRATIREGESHCIWPPEIIEKFRTADVILESAAAHYVVREHTLTRVR
jgi:hypothetical protein